MKSITLITIVVATLLVSVILSTDRCDDVQCRPVSEHICNDLNGVYYPKDLSPFWDRCCPLCAILTQNGVCNSTTYAFDSGIGLVCDEDHYWCDVDVGVCKPYFY